MSISTGHEIGGPRLTESTAESAFSTTIGLHMVTSYSVRHLVARFRQLVPSNEGSYCYHTIPKDSNRWHRSPCARAHVRNKCRDWKGYRNGIWRCNTSASYKSGRSGSNPATSNNGRRLTGLDRSIRSGNLFRGTHLESGWLTNSLLSCSHIDDS